MNTISKFIGGMFVFASLIMTSCKKDSVAAPGNEAEIVSAVEISLKESDADNETVYTWSKSSDTATIILAQGKAYIATMKVINGISSSTNRFYFEPSASSSIAVIDLNKDDKGLSVGTASKWVTEAAGKGIVKIAVQQASDNNKLASDIQAVFKTTVK